MVAVKKRKKPTVEENLGLISVVAKRYAKFGEKHGMTFEDLFHEGVPGLIKAVERFEPKRNVKFSTYAIWWIRAAIQRALVNKARMIRVPAHLHIKKRGFQIPSEPASLDAPIPSGPRDHETTLHDVIACEKPTPDEELHSKERAVYLERILKLTSLTPRERHVLAGRFADEERTLKEIGNDYGLSRERVRQLENAALQKLRQTCRRHQFGKEDVL